MSTTFTYDHPKYGQPVQHEIEELLEHTINGTHVTVKFKDKDRKGHVRTITVTTNSHYILRTEETEGAMPEVEVPE